MGVAWSAVPADPSAKAQQDLGERLRGGHHRIMSSLHLNEVPILSCFGVIAAGRDGLLSV